MASFIVRQLILLSNILLKPPSFAFSDQVGDSDISITLWRIWSTFSTVDNYVFEIGSLIRGTDPISER